MKFTFSRKTFQSILLIGIAAGGISLLFLGLLDTLVNSDLYNYGLQFNLEWANKYWTYMRLAAVSIGIFVIANCLALFYLYRARTRYYPIKTHPEPKLGSTKIVSLALFGTGIAALTASILYSSSTLAFIGLGLTFWGSLFLYIRTEKPIQQALIDKTASPPLTTLNQIITELGFKGQAVYLPPEYLKDPESSKVFIAKQEKTNLPTPKQVQKQEKMFFKKPEGILITPPGADLANLFEKTLDTSFTRIDLPYLERNLPGLLIEDMEIAENVEIQTKENRIYVKLENSIYKGTHRETEKLPEATTSIGCPICSAIACAIAKAAGKPVKIENHQTSEDGKTITTEYRLL